MPAFPIRSPLVRNRLFALLLGVAAGSILYGAVLGLRGDPEALVLAEGNFDAARVELDAFVASEPTAPEVDAAPWLSWTYHMPETVAREFLPQLKDPKERYDPWCGYVYRPHYVDRRDWPEHPDGRYEKHVNAYGVLSSDEVREEQPPLRVLVTGDSHVDGVCNPSEGYPLLLEAALEETFGAGEVEVLNAAHGGYSFLQYLGCLERFLWLGLKPDLFVMTVYGGNDFPESQLLWRLHRRAETKRKIVGDKADQQARRASAPRDVRYAYGQCVNAASYLHVYPGEVDFLIDVAGAVTAELRERCEEQGIEFLVVILPSPSDLPEQANWELIQRGLEHGGLGQVDLDRLTEMREKYGRWLEEQGIAFVDLHEPFKAHPGLLFWEKDLHLNLDGHRVAADAVLPQVLSLLGR